jgi:16S rRNA (adenine1518-N6/adenine1519-N6)-dimethyltransferase
MLQKEVVDRMAAPPSCAGYGRLSVMAQYHCRVERCFDVPPGAFRPVPAVDSAFVRLTPLPARPAGDPALLRAIVTRAFSGRRKTLRNALQGLVSRELLAAAGIDDGLRPENLDLAQYLTLANRLRESTAP